MRAEECGEADWKNESRASRDERWWRRRGLVCFGVGGRVMVVMVAVKLLADGRLSWAGEGEDQVGGREWIGRWQR